MTHDRVMCHHSVIAVSASLTVQVEEVNGVDAKALQ